MDKTTLLAILQQSEYDLPRWHRWIADHPNQTEMITPAAWTTKLKAIYTLSVCFFFLSPVTAITWAVHLTQPGETVIRKYHYWKAGRILHRQKERGLIVVAIAGSYAKTSTKHILNHALSGTHHVLVTPKSINTILGIAQVIERDLQSGHALFVVELGEYHRGDIAELCAFIQPDYGILTPIGRQHLDILGSFENVIAELSDLLAYFKFDPERTLVAEQNRQRFKTQKLTYYGTESVNTYRLTSSTITRAGTEYEVALPKKTEQPEELKMFSPLFGQHQAVNTLPAFWLGDKLDLDRTEIKKRIATLPYIHRRHEPTFAEPNVLILDNSYNTNADSINESLKLLNQLQPTNRIVVTLGFTETGAAAHQLHLELGEALAQQVDYLGLIEAPWTQDIVTGFTKAGGNPDHVKIGKDQDQAFRLLQDAVIPGSVVLFEGGYQEVYV